MNDEETLALIIERALAKAKTEHGTREIALTITKLQEARHWLAEHLNTLREAAKKMGHPSGL